MAQHGRYTIVRRVADGGMAEIFLATQVGREGFQKPVILKRIHSTIYADPQFRNMFIDEAHISMSLSHSNIVQILDLGVSAGRYFLVLELVDGWDLGRVLQRAAAVGTRLPRELGLYITADVCRALAYAHGKSDGDRPLGIVHRDVSPHNILLSEQGEVKLTDFGIAKAMNKREQTGTGVVKGKVAFMSPEQAMGKPIDARSDLFSLGTILYLLMTRSRPFEGPTDLETLLRVQKGDFTPAEATAPDLEPEVAAVISRAMRTDPAERYQTADEMLGDLENVLRTVFRPVGPTELKRWLAQLAAHDGVPSILRAPERPTGVRTGTGSSELEGNDVVLLDSKDVVEEEEEVVDGEEATSLAVVGGGGGGRPRISRARSANALPVPDDAEAALEGRGSRAELALPIPEGEEPPDRRRARRGGGFWKVVVFAILLVPGAYFGGKYARLWSDEKTDEAASANAGSANAAGAGKQAGGDKAAKAGDNPDKKIAAGAADAGTAATPGEAVGTEPTAATTRRGGEGSAREPATRRGHPGERKEYPRRTGPDLKDMMAPDPSLLPPTPAPAPAAPAPAAPSEPAPSQENP
jgi:serine/threonine-protein kinase